MSCKIVLNSPLLEVIRCKIRKKILCVFHNMADNTQFMQMNSHDVTFTSGFEKKIYIYGHRRPARMKSCLPSILPVLILSYQGLRLSNLCRKVDTTKPTLVKMASSKPRINSQTSGESIYGGSRWSSMSSMSQ